MNWFYLLLASIATGHTALVTNVMTKETDYHFTDVHGRLKLCVFCSESDLDDVVDECVEKGLKSEVRQLYGYNITYHPYCGSLKTTHKYHPRYIKNCTAAPQIPSASVNCKDENGNEFYRVHDKCNVTCTKPRTVASKPYTTCDPSTATWTNVTCIPDSCLPLNTKIERKEKTSCNRDDQLPLNTKCNVSCPLGYTPEFRELQCSDGDWVLTSGSCVEPMPGPQSGWIIPLTVGLTVLFAVALVILLLIYLCFKLRKKKEGLRRSWCEDPLETGPKSMNGDSEANQSDFPLITPPSVSSGSVSGEAEGKKEDGEVETSLSETSIEGRWSPSLSHNDPPPGYISATGYGDCSEPLLAGNSNSACPIEEECNSVHLNYALDDDSRGQHLPKSGSLNIAKGTKLTLYAECTKGHQIRQFNYGPPFHDDKFKKFGSGISLIIMPGDEGCYILAGRCDHQGDVMMTLKIYVTDPDQTDKKEPAARTDGLGSLTSTVTEDSLSAGSGPSEKLEAEPLSLPSNPQLSLPMESVGAESTDAVGARDVKHVRGSVVSLVSQTTIQDDDPEAESCTLPLTELRKQKSFKKRYDKLCVLLEPLDTRFRERTICGVIQHVLGYSIDKVDHVVWAKRENLRDSPARTLLSMMVQAGIRSLHLVRYFAQQHHKHLQVIQLLKDAHPNCPVCQRYS